MTTAIRVPWGVLRQRAFDDGAELHAVVRRLGFAARVLALRSVAYEYVAPAAGSGVARAGPVRPSSIISGPRCAPDSGVGAPTRSRPAWPTRISRRVWRNSYAAVVEGFRVGHRSLPSIRLVLPKKHPPVSGGGRSGR